MIRIYIAIIAVLGMFSLPATSATITDLQYQTVNGEEFTHNLVGPASNGTDGTLTAHFRGDFYDDGSFDEKVVSIFIDGNLLGSDVFWNGPGTYGNVQHSFDDREFYIDFSIAGALLSSIMADQLAVVTVDFGDGMNAFSQSYFSEVTLSYNNLSPVPIPAAALLFGSALLGFAGFSSRRKVA